MEWLWVMGLNGIVWVSSNRVARDGFRQPAGLVRGLATAILGWTWITVGLQIFGSMGLMARPPLLAWSLGGSSIALLCRWKRGSFRDRDLRSAAGDGWGWEGVTSLGLMLWVSAALLATTLALPVKVVSDGPIYHLYFAIRWWKANAIELVPTPFGENAAPYFPANGDLWMSWLVTSWGGDMLARGAQVPFLVLGAITVFAMCRRLGTSARASVISACWFAASLPLLVFSFEPNVDTLFVAGYLLGVFFLARYVLRDDGVPALVLGGLALGCSLGTKAVGIVFIPPLIVLAIVAALRREVGGLEKLGAVSASVASPLVPAGFWFCRNAWLTGNPLYPLHLNVFGRVVLAGWYGPEIMPLSQYFIPVTEWRALLDTLLAILDARLTPLWVLALMGLWSWGRRVTASLDKAVWGMSGLALLNIALYWLVIPYRTQQRFMLQALGLAAIPLARTLDRSRVLQGLAVVLLGIHLITDQGWPIKGAGEELPWDLTPLIPNSYSGVLKIPHDAATIQHMLSDPSGQLGLLAMLGLGSLSFVSAWGWSRLGTRHAPRSGAVALFGTSILIALHLALATPWDGDPRSRFYPRFPDYYHGWMETERIAGPLGARIAYAGTNLPYFLFGTGLRNQVHYVNVNRRPNWLLHDYHREASRDAGKPLTWNHPRPGWDRLEADYDAWLVNLGHKEITLLVVTRANPNEGPHNIADGEGFPIERVWADSHPDVFRLVYRDPLYRLYQIARHAP